MATDTFLKITGVTGESADAAHEDEIDVISWNWGMSQTGTTHGGRGAGGGKVSVEDITVMKFVDKATPVCIQNCCGGKHFEEAVLVVRKAGGEEPLEYLKITMKKVLVTHISTGGSGGEDRITETLTLNFAEFLVEYVPQLDDGSGDAAVEVEFNIAQNA